MLPDDLIAHCLTKPGAYVDHPWGEESTVVKVGGKIFCFLGDGPSMSVKNAPELIDEWRTRYPEHIGVPRYLKKQLWNAVTFDGAGAPDLDEACELIDDSYDLIVAALPKSKRPT